MFQSTLHTAELTCSCGASSRFSSHISSVITLRTSEFMSAHAACRAAAAERLAKPTRIPPSDPANLEKKRIA